MRFAGHVRGRHWIGGGALGFEENGKKGGKALESAGVPFGKWGKVWRSMRSWLGMARLLGRGRVNCEGGRSASYCGRMWSCKWEDWLCWRIEEGIVRGGCCLPFAALEKRGTWGWEKEKSLEIL